MNTSHRTALILLLLCCSNPLLAADYKPRRDLNGDSLPPGAVARLGTTRFRPGETHFDWVLAPDGKNILTMETGYLRVWEFPSGRLLRSFEFGTLDTLSGTQFSKDCSKVVVWLNTCKNLVNFTNGVNPPYMAVLDLRTGKTLFRSRGDEWTKLMSAIGFLADDQFLAVASRTLRAGGREVEKAYPVEIRDLRSGKLAWQKNGVVECACSPDGSMLATAEANRVIRIHDPATGRILHEWKKHDRPITDIAFAKNGECFASRDENGVVQLTNPRTGVSLHRMKDHLHGSHLFFSPDGQKILSAGNASEDEATARIWDVKTGKHQRSITVTNNTIHSLWFSTDSTRLLGSDQLGNLSCWNTATGELLIKQARPREIKRIPHSVSDPVPHVVSPDGQCLLWAEKNAVHEIRLKNGRELRRLELGEDGIEKLELTPDGKTLITSSPSLRFWDLTTGKEQHTSLSHRIGIDRAVFSPNGRLVASCDESQFVRMWHASSGKPVPLQIDNMSAISTVFINENLLAVIGYDLIVRLLNTADGKLKHSYCLGARETTAALIFGMKQQQWTNLAFSPNYQHLAFVDAGGSIVLRQAVDGKAIAHLDARMERLSRFEFSPDGSLLAARPTEKTLQLWDVPSGKLRLKASCTGSFAFSPVSNRLAWLDNNRARVWDRQLDKECGWLPIFPTEVTEIALEKQGKHLLVLEREKVCCWDVDNGRLVQSQATQHDNNGTLTHDRAGRTLSRISVCSAHSRFEIREPSTGRTLCELRWGNKEHILSPDGATLILGGEDLTFRETATGAFLNRISTPHLGNFQFAGFSPDGKLLATMGSDSTILLWDWQAICGLKTSADADTNFDAFWDDLASEGPATAYLALGRLRSRPKEALALLEKRLQPITSKDAAAVRQLLARFDDRSFAVRQRAADELSHIAFDWQFLLRDILTENLSLEQRRRYELIMSTAPRRWSPDLLRRLRCVTLLEMLNTDDAKKQLTKLAAGLPDSRLTEEAHASLRRLASPLISKKVQ